MFKIMGIGVVLLLAVALVAGSAYILLRPAEEPLGRGELHTEGGPPEHGYHGGEIDHGPTGTVAHEAGGGGEHPPETWTTITGAVIAFDHDLLVQTEEGAVVVHLGPEWHWEAVGFSFDPGDQVAVTGFYEDDGFETASIENLTTGQIATLRDETGRPLWAGRQGGRR